MNRYCSLILATVAISACADDLALNVQTVPIGARISIAGEAGYRVSPTQINFIRDTRYYDPRQGCYRVKGVVATWSSGATTHSVNPLLLCGKGNAWTVRLERDPNHPGIEIDQQIEQTMLSQLRLHSIRRNMEGNAAMERGMHDLGVGIGCAVAGNCSDVIPPISPTYTGVHNSQISGCNSDFDCGAGMQCVKAPANVQGACYKSESPLRSPNFGSVEPDRLGGSCISSVECPLGYSCNTQLQACVK